MEIEKPKRVLSEKQKENLKKMREKKQEISKAKKIIESRELEKRYSEPEKRYSEPEKNYREIDRITEKKIENSNNNSDFINRLSLLERDISEIKLRKQIKQELKNKLKQEKYNYQKSVDKDEEKLQKEEIRETKENINNIDYHRLFY